MLLISEVNEKIEVIVTTYGMKKLNSILNLFSISKKQSYNDAINEFCLHDISREMHLDPHEIIQSGKFEPSDARSIIYYMLTKHGKLSIKEIGRYYNNRSRQAIQSAIEKIESYIERPSYNKKLVNICLSHEKKLVEFIAQLNEIENHDRPN